MQRAVARKLVPHISATRFILIAMATTLAWLGANEMRAADPATVEITDAPAAKPADAKIDRKAGAAQQEMQWIWSPAQPLEKNVPPGVCYFRKSFTIGQPES